MLEEIIVNTQLNLLVWRGWQFSHMIRWNDSFSAVFQILVFFHNLSSSPLVLRQSWILQSLVLWKHVGTVSPLSLFTTVILFNACLPKPTRVKAVLNRTTSGVVGRNNKLRSEGKKGKRTYRKGAISFPPLGTTLMKTLVAVHGIHLWVFLIESSAKLLFTHFFF